MRVALDMTSAPAEGTGIAVAARCLADALDRTGAVQVLRLRPARGLRTPGRIWWDQVGLPQEASRRGADILHHTGFSASLHCQLPQVLTAHDMAALRYPEEAPTWPASFFWRQVLPRSVAWADRVVCVSGFAREELRELLPALRRPAPIVHWGLPPERARPATDQAREQVRRRYQLPGAFLLAVGSCLPRKDLPTLVRAFARLAPRHPDLVLALAGGRGPGEPALEQALRQAGLGARARRLGFVPDEDLPALYAAASVLAHPARYEGFGFPPLEAMAQGTPVVACHASSLPEVLRDGAAWFPPGDDEALAERLEVLLTSPRARAAQIARGRARVHGLSWERCAAGYLEVYASLVQPAAAAASARRR